MHSELVWAEIDLRAIAHNVRELRRLVRPDTGLMAVVKADGYGHGAVEVARTALQNGAAALGVARLGEAIELRNAGIRAPILIFGYTSAQLCERLTQFDLTQTVGSLETARELSENAGRTGRKIKVHIKVDTGMGRLGLLPVCSPAGVYDEKALGSAVHEIESIRQLCGLEVTGIYTHFAGADSSDKRSARLQLERFRVLIKRLERAGGGVLLKHAANSAALIDMPETHLDMVRPGISLYGLYPSAEVDRNRAVLQPAMSLKTRIVHLKSVPAGFKVSYGMTYATRQPTTIATVPIGYADGYSRWLSSQGQMLVRGRRVPVVGRVCMDLTMLDVGGIPDVELEDEVVVFGRQGSACITADALAVSLHTINYEVVSTVTARVPRVFRR